MTSSKGRLSKASMPESIPIRKAFAGLMPNLVEASSQALARVRTSLMSSFPVVFIREMLISNDHFFSSLKPMATIASEILDISRDGAKRAELTIFSNRITSSGSRLTMLSILSKSVFGFSSSLIRLSNVMLFALCSQPSIS